MSIADMIDDAPVMRSILSNFRNLLAQARVVKQSNDINPPLQLSDFESAVTNITKLGKDDSDHDSKPNAEPQHAALETAARHIFYEQLAASAEEEGSFTDICNLLDILQFCADKKQCDASLPLWLVEELLDSQTIYGCKRVFDYLESRRERMITNTFHKNKQMIVLRSCNELLRRLSRAEDAVFCGRVFMFLFQSFPLGDKSSVNLRGEFHVENITTFDAPAETTEARVEEDKMEVEEDVQEGNQSAPKGDNVKITLNGDEIQRSELDISKPAKIDESHNIEEKSLDTETLYSMFWGLQKVFSNPTKIFVTEEFDAFKKGLDATLQKFKSVNKVVQTHATPRNLSDSRQGTKRKRNRDDNELASTFNPKYLTSRDLFELEMSDLTFQRHILVQALILIDFLLSLTPKSKKKLAELKAQKAMVYQYTLSPDDTSWANTTRHKISIYLQEAPEGKFYYRMIDNVLSRDKNWVRWKTESCPPISLPPVPTSSYTAALTGAKRACATRRMRSTPMGSMDLNFLTEETGKEVAERRLRLLREPTRYQSPGTESYLREVDGVDLDVDMLVEDETRDKENKEKQEIGDEEKEKDNMMQMEKEKERKKEKARLMTIRASKTWRVLRMAAKSRLSILGELDERGSLGILGSQSKHEAEEEPKEEDEAGDEKAKGVDEDALNQKPTIMQDRVVPEVKIEGENTTTEPAAGENSAMQDMVVPALPTVEESQEDNEKMDDKIDGEVAEAAVVDGGGNTEAKDMTAPVEDDMSRDSESLTPLEQTSTGGMLSPAGGE